jgi:hypothetical protein
MAFRYAHGQSAMEFIVKIGRLGNSATVDAIALGDDKRVSVDIPVRDYISAGELPATPVPESTASSDDANVRRSIQGIYQGQGRLQDLARLVKENIIQKLAPGIHKDGYEETASTTAAAATGSSSTAGQPQPRNPAADPRQPYPANLFPHPDPLAANPPPHRQPAPGEVPPGFEDEYDILRVPGRGGGPGLGPRNPLAIGHDDLYPPGLGPNDPLRPHFGPSGGRGGFGGMHPTFDDPLFGGRGGPGGGQFGGEGGGLGMDPLQPPGARYDPTGPSDPRGGPSQFPGAGHRGPRGPPPPGNPYGSFGGGDFI